MVVSDIRCDLIIPALWYWIVHLPKKDMFFE